MDESEHYEEWSSCEFYGHVFEDFCGERQGSCRDCGMGNGDES